MNQIILKTIEQTIIYTWLDFYVRSLLRMIMYQRRFFWNHKWFRIYNIYDIQISRLLDTSVNPRSFTWLWGIHFKFQIRDLWAHDQTRVFLLRIYSLLPVKGKRNLIRSQNVPEFVVNAEKSPLVKNVCRCQSLPITVTKRKRNVKRSIGILLFQ